MDDSRFYVEPRAAKREDEEVVDLESVGEDVDLESVGEDVSIEASPDDPADADQAAARANGSLWVDTKGTTRLPYERPGTVPEGLAYDPETKKPRFPDMSKTSAMVAGFVEGIPLIGSDEGAAVAHLVSNPIDTITSDKSIADQYRDTRDYNRNAYLVNKLNEPNYTSGSEMASEALGWLTVLGKGKKAKAGIDLAAKAPSALSKMVKGAAAGTGFASEVGSKKSTADLTKGQVKEYVTDVAKTAVPGALVGGVAGVAPIATAVGVGVPAAIWGDEVGMAPVEQFMAGLTAVMSAASKGPQVVGRIAEMRRNRALQEKLRGYEGDAEKVGIALGKVLNEIEADKGDLNKRAIAVQRAADEHGIRAKELEDLLNVATGERRAKHTEMLGRSREDLASTKDKAAARFADEYAKAVTRASNEATAAKEARYRYTEDDFRNKLAGYDKIMSDELSDVNRDFLSVTRDDNKLNLTKRKEHLNKVLDAALERQKKVKGLEEKASKIDAAAREALASKFGLTGQGTQSDEMFLSRVDEVIAKNPAFEKELNGNEKATLTQLRLEQADRVKRRLNEPMAAERAEQEHQKTVGSLQSDLAGVQGEIAALQKAPLVVREPENKYAALPSEQLAKLVRQAGYKWTKNTPLSVLTDPKANLELTKRAADGRRNTLQNRARASGADLETADMNLPENYTLESDDLPGWAKELNPETDNPIKFFRFDSRGRTPMDAEDAEAYDLLAKTANQRSKGPSNSETGVRPPPGSTTASTGTSRFGQRLKNWTKELEGKTSQVADLRDAEIKAAEALSRLKAEGPPGEDAIFQVPAVRRLLKKVGGLEAELQRDPKETSWYKAKQQGIDAERRRASQSLEDLKGLKALQENPGLDPRIKTKMDRRAQLEAEQSSLRSKTPTDALKEGYTSLEKVDDAKWAAPTGAFDAMSKAVGGLTSEQLQDPATRAAYFDRIASRLEGIGDGSISRVFVLGTTSRDPNRAQELIQLLATMPEVAQIFQEEAKSLPPGRSSNPSAGVPSTSSR